MGVQSSKSLLTEILFLLQELNASVTEFQIELRNIKSDLHKTNEKLDNFIETYMPDDVAKNHVSDHRKMNGGLIRRIIKAIKNE